jgi:DNA transformation protein and related proteins
MALGGNSEQLIQAANIGPKSAAVLAKIGIKTLSKLKQTGAIKTYHLAKKAEPSVSLNLLWALEGAILGENWQLVARVHRTSLLLALEDYQNHAESK